MNSLGTEIRRQGSREFQPLHRLCSSQNLMRSTPQNIRVQALQHSEESIRRIRVIAFRKCGMNFVCSLQTCVLTLHRPAYLGFASSCFRRLPPRVYRTNPPSVLMDSRKYSFRNCFQKQKFISFFSDTLEYAYWTGASSPHASSEFLRYSVSSRIKSSYSLSGCRRCRCVKCKNVKFLAGRMFMNEIEQFYHCSKHSTYKLSSAG